VLKTGTQVQNHYPGTRLMLLSLLEKSANLTWSGKWSPCILTIPSHIIAASCTYVHQRFASPGSHSSLRIKIQDFSRPEIRKKSAPVFVPFQASTCEFDGKTRHCETSLQCQCNTSLSIATAIAVALLNINDDKQECNSSITSVYHLTHH